MCNAGDLGRVWAGALPVTAPMYMHCTTCKQCIGYAWSSSTPFAFCVQLAGPLQPNPHSMSVLGRVLLAAGLARAAYIVLALLSDRWLSDYDTSSRLTSSSCSSTWPLQLADAPHKQRQPLLVWDFLFMHRIAACGYEYEQFYAFFPAVPGEQPLLVHTASNHTSFKQRHLSGHPGQDTMTLSTTPTRAGLAAVGLATGEPILAGHLQRLAADR
jgi:hypothetical protein